MRDSKALTFMLNCGILFIRMIYSSRGRNPVLLLSSYVFTSDDSPLGKRISGPLSPVVFIHSILALHCAIQPWVSCYGTRLPSSEMV